jgi:hypothetical protein
MIERCRWPSARRALACALAVGSFTVLFFACYGPALFRGRQFGYRDAGHSYYPLYRRVQQEWDASAGARTGGYEPCAGPRGR